MVLGGDGAEALSLSGVPYVLSLVNHLGSGMFQVDNIPCPSISADLTRRYTDHYENMTGCVFCIFVGFMRAFRCVCVCMVFLLKGKKKRSFIGCGKIEFLYLISEELH